MLVLDTFVYDAVYFLPSFIYLDTHKTVNRA